MAFPPKKDPDDDEGEEEDVAGEGAPKAPGPADFSACGKACEAASAACVEAQAALDACATECASGGLQVATLTACEAACAKADAAIDEASAACAAVRGGEPEADPDSIPPPAPPPEPPPAPGAVAKMIAQAGTTEEQTQLAQVLDFGRQAMVLLGETDPARARGALAGIIESASTQASTQATHDEQRVALAWNHAIAAGSFTAGQVWEQTENSGKRSKKFTAYAAKINARHADPAELEAYLERAPKLGGRGRSDASAAISAEADAAKNAMRVDGALAGLLAKTNTNPARLAALQDALFAQEDGR